jgi:two-component system phosphate regulon sensor histidine kinase PhoR
MGNPWPAALTRTGLGLVAALLLGLAVGRPWLVLAVAALALLAFNLVQTHRLEQWLRRSNRQRPPAAEGLWGGIFSAIDRRQYRRRGRLLRLLDLLQRFRESVSAMPDGVIMLAGEGEMQWWNRLASRYMGLRWPQDRGQRIANLLRHPDFAAFLGRGDWNAAVKIPSPQDADRTLEIRIVPYGSDRQLLLARDVSELDRLETMRRDFVGNISHELRTPLTVLRGMSEQLNDSDAAASGELQRPLALMEQQVGRMSRLVDDLLLLSRLETESPPVEPGPVVVAELLRDVQDEARALSGGEHAITLTADEALQVEGDRDELRSAFSNLVSNAVKYTEAGGRIDIRWFEAAGAACAAVADTGKGIPAHHLPRLTERFYRVDAGRASREGGTGLGLAIVKHVLSRHGARLSVTSEQGVGSTFTAVFPHYQRVKTTTPASQPD